MTFWRLLLAAVLLCPGLASAARLRVCTDVLPHPPHLMPDGGGHVGLLVAQAAREAGFDLEFYAAPLTRCRAELELNLVHGFPMAPYMPEVLNFVQYPMRNGAPDSTRATLHARVMLYRRTGSNVTWDGKVLGGIKGKVLVQAEGIAMIAALRAAGASVDKSGRSLPINLAKLMAGRADLAAGMELEGEHLLEQPEWKGRIEALPLPLFEQFYFMVVSKPYYAQNGAAVDAMWDAIARLNEAAKTQKK